MARSDFLPFAWNTAANVMTQAQWEANPATMNGFSAGIARSREANKAWRQPAFITASLAQLIPDILDEDALDDGDRPKMTNQIERLIGAIANIYTDVKEAPIDNLTYGRRNALWTRVPSWEEMVAYVIGEAPVDNITYGRFNATWRRVLNWDEAWGNFLPLIGGQMYGYIRLHAWPADDYHAVPMGWVVAYVAGVMGALGGYLPLTGGSLSNPGHLNIYGNLNVVGGMVAYPYGDTHVSNTLHVGGVVNAGGFSTGGNVSASGVVNAGWFDTSGTISAGGVVNAGGFNTGGTVSANTVWANGIDSAGSINAAASLNAGYIHSYGDGTILGTFNVSGVVNAAGGFSTGGNVSANTMSANGITSAGSVTAQDLHSNDVLWAQNMLWVNTIFAHSGAAAIAVHSHISLLSGTCIWNMLAVVGAMESRENDKTQINYLEVGTLVEASDERYKSNIKEMWSPQTRAAEIDALAALRTVKFYSFDRLQEPGRGLTHHTEHGLVAQQIAPAMPDVVIDDDEPVRLGCADEVSAHCFERRPVKTIEIMPLLCYMIRGMQQMADRIETLEAKG